MSNLKNKMWFGWFVCILASLFYCYEYLLRIEPSVMMSSLMSDIDVNSKGFGYISTAYLIGYTPLQLVVGPLIDRYGSRAILIITLFLCVIGSFLFGFSTSLMPAMLGRLLIGIGSAFAFVGVLRLAAGWLPGRYFAFFVGLNTAMAMIGAMLGDIGMSYLVCQCGWKQTVFYIGYFGCLLLPLFVCYMKDPVDSVLGIKETRLLYNMRIVFANSKVLLVGFIGCVLYLSLCVVADIWGVGFDQALLHGSNIAASSANSMVYCGWLIGAPVMGWFSEIWKKKFEMVSVGTLLSGMIFSFILFFPLHSQWLLKLLLFLFGFFASVEVLCFAIGKESVCESQIGTALGVINFIIMLGGMLILPLVGKLLDVYWTGKIIHHVRVYTLDSYRHALLLIPVLFLIAFIFSLILKKSTSLELENS